MNKKRLYSFLAAGVFIALLLALGLIWKQSAPAPVGGTKHITVEVVHKDGSSKEFTYHTDAEYLGDVLAAEGLISGAEGEFGLFVNTVDGETADYSVDGGWWQLTHNGETAQVGADTLPVQDGDTFSWVYTIG